MVNETEKIKIEKIDYSFFEEFKIDGDELGTRVYFSVISKKCKKIHYA